MVDPTASDAKSPRTFALCALPAACAGACGSGPRPSGAARWLLVVAAMIAPSPARLVAVEPTGGAPFVGAFERFGRHHEIDPALAGRLLISELSCTACHASGEAALRPKRGPNLSGAGNRLDATWIKQFIADPQAIKPGTTMPDVLYALSERDRSQAAAALAAYLDTQREPLPEIKGTGLHPVPHQFWNLGNVDRGRTLFHRVGCVACHEPDPQHATAEMPASQIDQLLELLDPEEIEELGLAAAARTGPAQPLGALAQQYSLRSLALFLLDPEATRPGGRMPNFKLSAVDAADIAAYLMQRSAADSITADFSLPDSSGSALAEAESQIAVGRRLFTQYGCAGCHQSDAKAPEVTVPDLEQVNPAAPRGCLADRTQSDGHGSAITTPRWSLDRQQLQTIGAALASSSEAARPADERLKLQLLQLNCYACHERDGSGGVSRDRRAYFETVAHEDLGDEGRLPPPLSGVGRKLRPAWLNRVLQGNGDMRPHMHARMPKFPAAAVKELGALLLDVDRAAAAPHTGSAAYTGDAAHRTRWPAAEDEQHFEAGRSMLDAGCVQCHRFRGESLPGVVGVDLQGIADRVEPQWFREFLYNPGAIKPRTRMPSFFPDGQSQNAELLGGDADRQIAAMWGYLKTLSRQPLPAKIEEIRAKDFELKPRQRPIVLRTFMHEAGTHAIAVGFPEQVHFAFDAHSLRLAAAWRDRFLDAQGTWFIRAAPPARPLGADLITIADADLFIFANDSAEPQRRFHGFRLDDHGVPVFAYSVGDLQVEDRITPLILSDASKRPGLRRRLRIKSNPISGQPTNVPASVAVRILSGERLTAAGDGSVQNDRQLSATLPQELATLAQQRRDGVTVSWVLPLTLASGNDGDEPALWIGEPATRGANARGANEHGQIELEMQYQW